MNADPELILSLIQGACVSADVAKIKGGGLLRDAGVDSLDMMNVLLAVEEKFGIKIPDDDIPKLETVAGIVAYLNGRPT
jgi:acyl carrier protein